MIPHILPQLTMLIHDDRDECDQNYQTVIDPPTTQTSMRGDAN
jgi:hypothetical protein